MKNVKCGPQNLALVTLMLAALSAPVAKADEAISMNPFSLLGLAAQDAASVESNGLVAATGTSVGELNKIIPNFKVQQGEQDKRDIQFVGSMPKRCAKNASVDYKFKDGKHFLQFNIPACANGFKPVENEAMVAVSSVFNRLKLADETGDLYVLRREAGDPNDTSLEISDERLTDRTGALFSYRSNADAQAAADAAEDAIAEQEKLEAEAERLQAEATFLADMQKQIEKHCKDGNMPALSEAILSISDVLGESTETLLEEIDEAQKSALEEKLANAETAEEAKAAYNELLTIDGVSKDDAKKAYIEKRNEILDAIVADPVDGYKAAAKAIKDWKNEIKKLLKAKDYEAIKETFAQRYSALATHAANNNDIKTAVALYDEAKAYTNAQGKRDLDNAVATLHVDQFKKCLQENPLSPKSCDAFANKAKARSQSIEQSLKQETGEDAEANLAAFQLQQVQTFGYGGSYNMDPLGQMSMNPGLIGQMKYEGFMAAYYAQQQNMWMQMMNGNGMMMNGTNGGRGGLFGL